jgi:hypothetical protein
MPSPAPDAGQPHARTGHFDPSPPGTFIGPSQQEDAAQQPCVDGGQQAAPIGLPLREGARWFQAGELLGVRLGLGQPGGGGWRRRQR